MKSSSRWVFLGTIIALGVIATTPIVLARGGGGHGGGRGRSTGSILCSGGPLFELSLSSLDLMIKASDQQKVVLDELRKVARQNSEAMAKACEGETPASVPAKIDASERRLEIALINVKRIMPIAKKFYGTLSEEQKAQLNNFFDWPNW